jgi:outer membrane receptor for ferrienterochelin and colicins
MNLPRHSLGGTLLLTLVLLSAGPVWAADASLDQAEEADVQFGLGVEAYRDGDYLGAVEHLLASNRLVPNRNVVYNLARAYERLGRLESAWRQYDAYVQLETDPARRAEGVAARDRLAGKVALLYVDSYPSGATVYVDRLELGARGTTPLVMALPSGEHSVFVAAEGYHAVEAQSAQLTAGTRVTTGFKLSPVLGTLRVSGTPGAEVRVDDPDADAFVLVPAEGAAEVEAPPGPHTLYVRASGRRDAEFAVTVVAEAVTSLTANLAQLTGTLVVDAPEKGALIEVDGRAAGFTPAVLNDLPAGRHHVVVTLSGFRPSEADVIIEVDKSVSLESALISMNEVTAASRSAEAAEDAPASVTLVSSEEIRAFGDSTVWEALAGQRGFFAYSDRTYEFLGVRGFGKAGDYNNRILLTLDGHALNDDQLGASYVGHDGMVDLYDLERIEIVRGAGSVLYGSNAFLGVVNLVNREGDRARPTHVVVAGESGQTARVRAGVRAKLGKNGEAGTLSVSGGGVLSQGSDFVFPELSDSESGGVSSGADGYLAAGGQARLQAGDWSVTAYFQRRNKRIGTGSYETDLADPRAHTVDNRGFGEVRFAPDIGARVHLDTRAYVDRYDYQGVFPYGDDAVVDTWHGMWGGAEARVTAKLVDAFELTAGGEARVHALAHLLGADASGTYLDSDAPFQVYSGYLLGELTPSRVITVSGGARVDAYSTFGATVNPRVALILHPAARHTVKLLAGRAFEAPSPYELQYNDNGTTQVAAPDLQPQTIWSGEAEYTLRLGQVSTWSTSVFGHRIADLIDIGGVAGQDELVQYTNLAEPVNAVGLESELRREWRSGWMAAGTLTLQRTREGGLPWDDNGSELINSPAAIVGIRGAAPVIPGVATLATRVRVESGRLTRDGSWTDAAVVWDVNATGSIGALGVDWSVGVRNLLDWRIAYPTGEDLTQNTLPGPARAVVAQVGRGF